MQEKWEDEAVKAFTHLFTSDSLTELDEALFGDAFTLVAKGQRVSFPDSDCIKFKRIRANRIKYLGYKWTQDTKTWEKPK